MDNIFEGDGSGRGKNSSCNGNDFIQPGEKDTIVQLIISLTLGLTAFFTFCVCPSRLRSANASNLRQKC